MRIYYSPTHAGHAVKGEFDGVRLIPAYEVPQRAESVRLELISRRIGTVTQPDDFGLAPIARIHDPAFMDFLKHAFQQFQVKHGTDVVEAYPSSWPARRLRQIPGRDIDGRMGYYGFDVATPILAGTWDAALQAVNCALSAARAVKSGDVAAFALCRPPGHHAATDLYGGYCFFNNAAIAAQWLTDQGARVAILDVDYHHGNGTQEIFYARKDVLTASIHADPAVAYPHFLGYTDELGDDEGEGFNLNVVLPFGTDWSGYAEAFAVARKRVAAFAPDILIVPLGLDTYAHDPIAKFQLHKSDYFSLGRAIAELKLPTVFTMEGGYALNDLGEITANVLEAYLNG